MSSKFELTPMKAFLRHRKEFLVVDDTKQYKRVTAKLHAQGTVLRDEIQGSELKTKKQQAVKAGDLLVAEIDAKVGGAGIIPPELAGGVVSSHYFLYEVDATVCLPKYLEYYIRSGAVEEQFQRSVRGSTNYASIRADHTLQLQIPLPSLDEQLHIVARIEELEALIEEARALRAQAREEADVLFQSVINLYWRNQDNWATKPVGEIATIVSGQVDPRVEPYASLPHINGTVIEAGTCRLLSSYRFGKEDGIVSGKYHFKPGAILYSKIRPYLRKAVQVPFEGICSADVYAFDSIDPALEPRFFMYSLISPQFTEYANALSGRTRIPKLNQKQLFAFKMTYPPLDQQRRIVVHLDALQSQAAELTAVQDATQAELGALLPSILDRAFKGEL